MATYPGSRRNRRSDLVWTVVFLAIGLVIYFMPAAYQTEVRQVLRRTALRPFIAMQSTLVARENQRVDIGELRAARDSLVAVVSAQAPLVEENRRLRALLGLHERAQPDFVPAELVRIGVTGGESSFLLDVGSDDGTAVGSPVIAASGLLGVVREADGSTALGIDWTHPDFRASVMTADGEAYGIVEPRPGRYREEDLLTLTGAPFHSDIQPGTRIVTSGRGGVYPRGIPIGIVLGIDEADTGWRKSYILRPLVRPEAVTHVLVGVQQDGELPANVSALWYVPAPPDTVEQRSLTGTS